MRNGTCHIPRLEIRIFRRDISRYTSLLQSGIFLESRPTNTVGDFLASLPGFTPEYIIERIETIFLNSDPLDDLDTVVGTSSPVLAISSGMPTIGGAVFRRSSFPTSRRSLANNVSSVRLQCSEKVMVKLKCFNTIASERGETLLQTGCLITSDTLLRFIRYRPRLFSEVVSLSCDDETLGADDLETVLHRSETVYLRIHEDNDPS